MRCTTEAKSFYFLIWLELLAGTVPANKLLLAGTFSANKSLLYREVGVCANETFVFFSIVRHSSTQLRTPVPRGMASQHHLRGYLRRIPYLQVLYLQHTPYLQVLYLQLTSSIKDNTKNCILKKIYC